MYASMSQTSITALKHTVGASGGREHDAHYRRDVVPMSCVGFAPSLMWLDWEERSGDTDVVNERMAGVGKLWKGSC